MTKRKRSWIAIGQPVDAEQFDASSMKVLDCWTSFDDRKAVYAECNKRLAGWLAQNPECKISLFEGDLTAQHFRNEVQ